MVNGLFDCTGKVTMVTGGNGGVGLGFAMGCAKMGGDIAIWARNEEKNAAAKARLEAAGAGRVEAYVVDVSSEEQVITGYDRLMADFGRVDCVFANSGGAPMYDSVFDMPTQAWHDFQAVALHGAFFTLREGARHMVARAEAGEPGGSLVACGGNRRDGALSGRRAGQAPDPRQCRSARHDRHAHVWRRPSGREDGLGYLLPADAARAPGLPRRFRRHRRLPVQRCVFLHDRRNGHH